MGRTKAKKLARAKKNVDPPPPPNSTSSQPKQPSIPALLEKTQALIIQCDYPMACKFASRILELEEGNAEAREMMGVALLEMGELDGAKQAFLALASTPSPPPSAHLYLAQLCDEDPQLGLRHYQAAIDILSVQLKGKGKDRAHDGGDEEMEMEMEIKANIVRALVGQVEIWMDPSYDLCYEPDADKNCERLLELALQTDPGNTEALQSLANVRMSQERPDDARECLEKAWMVWKDLDLDDPRVPPIETRLSIVKLFLELELYAPALLVLHGVMSSDDEEVEAWYLEGWCYFLMAEKAKESGGQIDEMSWEELATDARARLEKCQMLHLRDEHPDVPLLEHVRELIKQLEALGIHAVPDDEEGDWEDDDGEDDDDEDEDGDVEMS